MYLLWQRVYHKSDGLGPHSQRIIRELLRPRRACEGYVFVTLGGVMKRLYGRVYGTALVILVVTVVVAAWQMLTVAELEAQRAQTTERLVGLFWINKELLAAETAQRGYLMVGDIAFREELDTRRDEFVRLMDSLGDDADLVQLRDLANRRMAAMMQAVEVHDTQGAAAAVEMVRQRAGAALMDRFTTLSRNVIEADQRQLEFIRARTADINRILNLLLTIGSVLILFMAGVAMAGQRRDLRVERAISARLEAGGRRIAQLNELNNNLLSCRNSGEANLVIGNALQALFPGTAGGVYAYRASRDVLELQGSWGAPGGDPQQVILADECWSLRRGHPHLHRSATDLHCKHWRDPEALRSICVPMMAQGETVGLVFFQCLDDADSDVLFADDVQALADTAASQVASAVANFALRAALHQQSVKDPLTGLYNRRFLEESLQREVVRAERSGSPLAVIMADIDHFKNLNDQHGHQAGDLLLQRIGGVLLAGVRGGDLACRYGGEEFTLVLPGADLELAARRAEEIRAEVEAMTASLDGALLPRVTASFGAAVFPQHGTDPRGVIQRADSALYRAKQQGRNRVVVAD